MEPSEQARVVRDLHQKQIKSLNESISNLEMVCRVQESQINVLSQRMNQLEAEMAYVKSSSRWFKRFFKGLLKLLRPLIPDEPAENQVVEVVP